MSVRSAVAAGLVLNIVMVGSLHAQSTQQTKIRDSSVLSESVEPKAGAAESKTFTWPQTATAGSCRINNGATMTIRSDGTASWKAQVESNGGSDSWCATMTFYDRNGLVLEEWPRFCSQTLVDAFRDWIRNDLAIHEANFPYIVRINRADHC